jgi:hypothetical protein
MLLYRLLLRKDSLVRDPICDGYPSVHLIGRYSRLVYFPRCYLNWHVGIKPTFILISPRRMNQVPGKLLDY